MVGARSYAFARVARVLGQDGSLALPAFPLSPALRGLVSVDRCVAYDSGVIPELLDFIAGSVRDGTRPGNGKREWTFIVLAVAAAIFVVVIVFASTS
jgi:hypothetical protein